MRAALGEVRTLNSHGCRLQEVCKQSQQHRGYVDGHRQVVKRRRRPWQKPDQQPHRHCLRQSQSERSEVCSFVLNLLAGTQLVDTWIGFVFAEVHRVSKKSIPPNWQR